MFEQELAVLAQQRLAELKALSEDEKIALILKLEAELEEIHDEAIASWE